jgi:hypothetical protein
LRVKNHTAFAFSICAALFVSGCATYDRHGLEIARARQIEKNYGLKSYSLPPQLENKILALNPDHVTAADITNVLLHAPAPRIINIHGGIYPVHRQMISFSKFLIGMGYPESSIRNPCDGTWTFSCYESASMIAGMVAWYYEKEGLRPMMIGHSQGGMQVVRILDYYASDSTNSLEVWCPLTWKSEGRHEITDPLTGKTRPLVGLQLPYAAAMGAGGLTRFLPNQWDMNFVLRTIPDSVEEFTGFYKGYDWLGGDLLGYGPMNYFHASGTAKVRNVRLPTTEGHGKTPAAEHLLKSQQIRDWINNYTPIATPNEDITVEFDSDSRHILFAADVWYSVKKHWVLELQRLIIARRNLSHSQSISGA